jgi:hypothetical protein
MCVNVGVYEREREREREREVVALLWFGLYDENTVIINHLSGLKPID